MALPCNDPVDPAIFLKKKKRRRSYSYRIRQCRETSNLGNLVTQTGHQKLFCAAAPAHQTGFFFFSKHFLFVHIQRYIDKDT